MKQFLLSAAFFALLVPFAQAQQALKLEISGGVVNLEATSVPVRQILAEWARIGGTKVVGGEKIPGAPLTLKLVDLPERQALDIILRNVAGYMAAPRLAAATPGASSYDRIVILPTSTAVATAAPATTGGIRMPNAQGPMTGLDRRIPPRPPGLQQADADDPDDPDEPPDPADTGVVNNGPVFTFPQQPQPQVPGQVFMPVPQGVNGGQPQITLQPNPNGQPTIYNFVPTPSPNSGGFGVIGSPTPGTVAQPAPAPGQPTPVPPRPPGGF
jgi:hypothetical protein